MDEKKRLRILHILYPLVRGGIETWMLHVLRHCDPARYEMHFATHRLGCSLDGEYRSLGAKLHLIAPANRPLAHIRSLRSLVKREGPFDIVHSHVHHSGLELFILRHSGIPVRIAHAHNTAGAWRYAPLPERLVVVATLPLIRKYATHGLACSQPAAKDFFGPDWRHDLRYKVLHYGIPLRSFPSETDESANLRERLNLPPNSKIVAVVGRLAYQKNHALTLAIAEIVRQKMPEVHFVFLGDGPLRQGIHEAIRDRRLQNVVHLAGSLPNVPQLMESQLDLLLLPSLWEGLPMVTIEAQAAGLPAVVSDAVPEEAVVIPDLLCRLSLKLPPSDWAKHVIEKISRGRTVPMRRCIEIMSKTDFEITASVRGLFSFYEAAKLSDK